MPMVIEQLPPLICVYSPHRSPPLSKMFHLKWTEWSLTHLYDWFWIDFGANGRMDARTRTPISSSGLSCFLYANWLNILFSSAHMGILTNKCRSVVCLCIVCLGKMSIHLAFANGHHTWRWQFTASTFLPSPPRTQKKVLPFDEYSDFGYWIVTLTILIHG